MAKRRKVCTATVPAQHDKPVKYIAAYIRVSTDEQVESGLGLEAQRSQVAAMALVKGWSSPLLFEDAGVTGTKNIVSRPAGGRLVKAIESGEVEAIIVPALDRIGRRATGILNFAELCNEHHVSLVSCKESLDTSTPAGQFTLTLFAGVAQLERDTISSRTKAALAIRGQRDGEKGGKLPYGYVRTPGGVVINEEAANIVRRIFALHRRGRPLRAIADAVSTSEKQISHSSVAEILKNREIYKGARRGESSVCWPIIL